MGSVEDALTSIEEDRLKKHIIMKGTAQDLFGFYMMADFGLRVGELNHFEPSWLDISRGMLRIPDKRDCDCSRCMKNQKHPGVWKPKTKAGARTLPVKSAFPEAYAFVLKYVTIGGPVERSRQKVHDRVAALGRKIEREKKDSAGRPLPIYPHCLRSTAAMKFASRTGVTSHHVLSWFGWGRIETANAYIEASGAVLERLFAEK